MLVLKAAQLNGEKKMEDMTFNIEQEYKLSKQLLQIKELIKHPDNWCKKFTAQDKSGSEVGYLSEFAHSFCLIGAIKRTNPFFVPDYSEIIEFLSSFIPKGVYIYEFNDNPKTKHSDVMALIDTAIEKSLILEQKKEKRNKNA